MVIRKLGDIALDHTLTLRMNALAADIASAEGFQKVDVRRVLETVTNPIFSERLRGVMDLIDQSSAPVAALEPARLPLYVETCAIYGCRDGNVERIAAEFGMVDTDVIQFAASVTYGPRSIVVIQQLDEKIAQGEGPTVFVYIYNADANEPGQNSMVFYQAPDILGSI